MRRGRAPGGGRSEEAQGRVGDGAQSHPPWGGGTETSTHSTLPSSFRRTTTPKGSSWNSTLYSVDEARLRTRGVSRGTS